MFTITIYIWHNVNAFIGTRIRLNTRYSNVKICPYIGQTDMKVPALTSSAMQKVVVVYHEIGRKSTFYLYIRYITLSPLRCRGCYRYRTVRSLVSLIISFKWSNVNPSNSCLYLSVLPLPIATLHLRCYASICRSFLIGMKQLQISDYLWWQLMELFVQIDCK